MTNVFSGALRKIGIIGKLALQVPLFMAIGIPGAGLGSSSARVTFPCLVDAGNLMQICSKGFEGKFVFHIPSKRLAVSHSNQFHKNIAKITMPDIDTEKVEQRNIVGGTISVFIFSEGRKIGLFVDPDSLFFDTNKELAELTEYLKEMLTENGYGNISIKEKRGGYLEIEANKP